MTTPSLRARLPWRREADKDTIMDADGRLVLDGPGSDFGLVDHNAHLDFIATACNAHEKLVEALKECADDLESEINGTYQGYRDKAGEIHPAMQAKYERDMATVKRARAALSEIGK